MMMSNGIPIRIQNQIHIKVYRSVSLALKSKSCAILIYLHEFLVSGSNTPCNSHSDTKQPSYVLGDVSGGAGAGQEGREGGGSDAVPQGPEDEAQRTRNKECHQEPYK